MILGGTLALATMMDEGGFDELEVSEAGLREGIFFERLLEGSDPPLFEDVRRESVINLAHRYRTDDKHVGHVAKLSLRAVRLARARPGSTTSATPSASCCGRPASCTTSAWRSTTTTIITTPPT